MHIYGVEGETCFYSINVGEDYSQIKLCVNQFLQGQYEGAAYQEGKESLLNRIEKLYDDFTKLNTKEAHTYLERLRELERNVADHTPYSELMDEYNSLLQKKFNLLETNLEGELSLVKNEISSFLTSIYTLENDFRKSQAPEADAYILEILLWKKDIKRLDVHVALKMNSMQPTSKFSDMELMGHSELFKLITEIDEYLISGNVKFVVCDLLEIIYVFNNFSDASKKLFKEKIKVLCVSLEAYFKENVVIELEKTVRQYHKGKDVILKDIDTLYQIAKVYLPDQNFPLADALLQTNGYGNRNNTELVSFLESKGEDIKASSSNDTFQQMIETNYLPNVKECVVNNRAAQEEAKLTKRLDWIDLNRNSESIVYILEAINKFKHEEIKIIKQSSNERFENLCEDLKSSFKEKISKELPESLETFHAISPYQDSVQNRILKNQIDQLFQIAKIFHVDCDQIFKQEKEFLEMNGLGKCNYKILNCFLGVQDALATETTTTTTTTTTTPPSVPSNPVSSGLTNTLAGIKAQLAPRDESELQDLMDQIELKQDQPILDLVEMVKKLARFLGSEAVKKHQERYDTICESVRSYFAKAVEDEIDLAMKMYEEFSGFLEEGDEALREQASKISTLFQIANALIPKCQETYIDVVDLLRGYMLLKFKDLSLEAFLRNDISYLPESRLGIVSLEDLPLSPQQRIPLPDLRSLYKLRDQYYKGK